MLFQNKAKCQTPGDSSLVIEYVTDLEEMINNFILSGVTVSNVTFTGHNYALGSFTGGVNTNIGMEDGILIATGNVMNAYGPNDDDGTTTDLNTSGDPLLNMLTGNGMPTYDAGILELDVVPEGNVLVFNYVFASEEYHEYVSTPFNDIFAFFFSGSNPYGDAYINTNIALIPETNLPVAINNINNGTTNNGPCKNCQYFVDNTNGASIQYDAFTTVLPIMVYVVPGQTYHLRMSVGDTGDGQFDSGIFLECPSLKSYTVTEVDVVKMPVSMSVYPNPVNSSSLLLYNLENSGSVTIRIYNMAGVEVCEPINGFQSAGDHSIPLNCLKQKGIYTINLTTGVQNRSLKVVVR